MPAWRRHQRTSLPSITLYAGHAATVDFTKIAALDSRHDVAWAVDANGIRRAYKVWWTGGFDGLQQNLVTEQFRYIRAVPYIPECEQQSDVKDEEASSSSAPAAQWKADDGGRNWDQAAWSGQGSDWKKEKPW